MGEEDAAAPSERSSPDDEEDEAAAGPGEDGISEYEKQRLSRIQENRARVQALGLPHLASSLLKSSSSPKKPKNKANKKKGGDDDYRPSDEEDKESPPSSEEEEDDRAASGSRRKGKKSNSSAAKVRKTSRGRGKTEEYIAIEDDVALQQAISLSLGRTIEESGAVLGELPQNPGNSVTDGSSRRKKDKASIKETSAKRNIGKNRSRLQLTEDEVVAYFFTFDGAGNGHIALRDLQRMVAAYDFTWTDMEIANMIYSFDSDGDGKLSLEDFRTIVSRCNMLLGPKEC